MSLLRRCLERVSRRVVLTRRLPARFGGRKLWVTPGAALAYYYPLDSGRWTDLFDLAEHGVKPGDSVWDIGANLGVFAFAAAHRAGPAGEVLAVEADPWLTDLMRRSVAQDGGAAATVHVLCAAVAAGHDLQMFATTARARSGSHLVSAPGSGEYIVGPTIATHPVVTIGLDWLLAYRRPPAVVKIDVEGAELPVLQGASMLLSRHRPRLLLEVYESNADAITWLLGQHRYELMDFSAGWAGRRPVERAVYHTLALPLPKLTRMHLAHIVPSLEDRHGGPSKSVRALANSQAGLGESVELLTTVEAGSPVTLDGGDAAAVRLFPRVTPRWLARSPGLRAHLRAADFDCVHHHSLWLLTLRYAHEAARRRRVPLVISPRGMMSGWAYSHRRWRKALAELLVHPGAFAGAAGWHATSPEEAEDIRALGFRQPVCVSPNGVTVPTNTDLAAARTTWLDLCPPARTRPVALFYSRLHRKKRLRELIDLWLSVPRGDWLLLIAGLAEDYTAAGLAAEVAATGGADRIAVFDGADRPPPYAIASLFVLPSHSENFGLVIAEAMAAGVPALVTNTTPWTGLAACEAGWCVAWEKFGEVLGAALATRPAELEAMGRRGREWVARDFSWDRAARLLDEFYRHLCDERA